MTAELRALLRVTEALESESIPYMLTGSLASSYHGRPRTTHDADLVVDPDPAQLVRLVRHLSEAGFWLDPPRGPDALRRWLPLNAVETATGWKIDLFPRPERPWSRAELDRRRPALVGPAARLAMVSPEDAILSKLEWTRKPGEAEKHFADVRGVLEVSPDLDRRYIESWAVELGIFDLWRKVSGGTPPARPGAGS